MTTLLFLHTEAPTRRALARAFVAATRPGRLVLASDEITAEDRAFYDECVALPPPQEVRATLRLLERVPADVVVAQTEYGLLPGALLAAARGLPGPDLFASFLATHKWLQRRQIARAGVPQPVCALCGTVSDVRARNLGFPLVLKPVASTLGRLVRKVECDKDLDAAVAALRAALPRAPDVLRLMDFAPLARFDLECDPTREFLAESFAPGAPLETDGIVVGEGIDVFGATAQVVSPPPTFYVEGYLFPAPDPGGIEESSRRAVEALGLSNTGFSIEFRGERLIEVNGRLGEDDGFPDLFEAALGRLPLLKLIQGDGSPSRPRGSHAVAYKNRYAPGTVRDVKVGGSGGSGGSAGSAGAAGCGRGEAGPVVLVKPGDAVAEPGTPGFAPHLAYALASHPTDVAAAYAEARRCVEGVEVEFARG